MAQSVGVAPQPSHGDRPGRADRPSRTDQLRGVDQVGQADQLRRIDRLTGTGARQGASLVLSVPAHRDFVVIIRSAVAQLAACFDFTVQEITDLRLAVNEACGLLVAGPRGSAFAGTLDCRAEMRGDLLRVTVAAPAGGFDAPEPDGLGWTLMSALVDALAWAQDGVTARINLEKRRGRPGG